MRKMVNFFLKYLKAPVFGVIAFVSTYATVLILDELRLFRGPETVSKIIGAIGLVFIPGILMSFLSIKLNNTYAYSKSVVSIVIFSFFMALSLIVQMHNQNSLGERYLERNLYVIIGAFLAGIIGCHATYLLAYLTRKKKVANKDVLDS